MKKFMVYVRFMSDTLRIEGDALLEVAKIIQGFSPTKTGSVLHFDPKNKSAIIVFVNSNKAAGQIRSAIEGSTYIRNGDAIFVLELGEEFSAIGASASWAWLQHN